MPVRRRRIPYREREALVDSWQSRCAYCGERTRFLGPEHVEPLSRGGEDTPDNLVAACNRCNGSKSNLLLLEWVLVTVGFWRRSKPPLAYCRVAEPGFTPRRYYHRDIRADLCGDPPPPKGKRPRP